MVHKYYNDDLEENDPEEFERNLIADYDEEELDPGIYDCEEPELGISDDNWACGTLEVDWGMDD
jgi:hypothetical protein